MQSLKDEIKYRKSFLSMTFNFYQLSYKAKIKYAEITYLIIICIIIPLAGVQYFSFSHALGNIFLNIISLPALILFYKVYLEKILLKKKWWISILLFPLFFILYDLYQKLCYFLIINYAFFLSQSYRDALKAAHPENILEPIANFGYTIFTFLTAFAFVMFKRLYEREKKIQKLRYSNIKLELENLRAQIQPHFFFNTLNDLYNLSLQNSPKAPKIIERLSSIMRYVLYEGQHKVPLTKEIEFMNDYFDLEKIRHTNPDLIDFKVQGNLEGIKIEALLFLPLIENCFKHALQKDVLESSIKIILVVDEDELTFQTNNKLFEKNPDKSGRIDLENVKKRLNLLYGNKQQLYITKDKDQFIVTVTIQL